MLKIEQLLHEFEGVPSNGIEGVVLGADHDQPDMLWVEWDEKSLALVLYLDWRYRFSEGEIRCN